MSEHGFAAHHRGSDLRNHTVRSTGTPGRVDLLDEHGRVYAAAVAVDEVIAGGLAALVRSTKHDAYQRRLGAFLGNVGPLTDMVPAEHSASGLSFPSLEISVENTDAFFRALLKAAQLSPGKTTIRSLALNEGRSV